MIAQHNANQHSKHQAALKSCFWISLFRIDIIDRESCSAAQCGTSAKLRRILRSAPVSSKHTVPPYPTIASSGGTAYKISTALKPSCADCFAAGIAEDAARRTAGTIALEMEFIRSCWSTVFNFLTTSEGRERSRKQKEEQDKERETSRPEEKKGKGAG